MRRMTAIQVLLLALSLAAGAQDQAPTPKELQDAIAAVQKQADIVWTMVAAALVFFMQAGFAMVETGFTRAKNAGNIMMKNLTDCCMGALAFWAVGFGLMFGRSNGLTGWSNFLTDFNNSTPEGQWGFTFWLFQVVFAATAATIVSGAMAERTKFSGYLIYSFIISLFVYPVFGHWAWGNLLDPGNAESGAWLARRGFIDFAGSTVVHSVGGWAALAGAMVLGPRLGKYGKDGKARVIPGHSLTLATLGVFILFLGWFGFNAGSTTAANGLQARIAVNTLLAGCLGALGALLTSWVKFRVPDIGMTLNGCLAGLVAITSPCATVTPLGAVLIGALAGIIVVFSVLFFDRLRVDDPVGAISVHGVCGAFGTIAAALFHENLFTGQPYNLGTQLMTQLIGVAAAFAWTFPVCWLMFKAIALTVGLRVSAEEEIAGLDLGEHSATAYPDFAPSPATGGISLPRPAGALGVVAPTRAETAEA
ncbi:MAG: ammonium transporter [Bryobacterales bacterium]|nr:ammonium transporter [Bryobacteraceae bacterium]MDW8354595.1 ammonium transporter [Bryobacterales bacterium]